MSIDSGEIERLIDALQSRDEQKFIRAYEQLKAVGETAVSGLVEALHRDDWPGRYWVPLVLGSMGTVAISAVPDLIAIVGRRSLLSVGAVNALGSIRDPSAVPCLIKALGDEADVLCSCAAIALGRIGDLRAVDPLIGVLRKRRTWVPRGAAAFALGEIGIGARGAIPALEKALCYKCRKGIFFGRWNERAREAVRDAIDRIKGLSKETKLEGHGYLNNMWGTIDMPRPRLQNGLVFSPGDLDRISEVLPYLYIGSYGAAENAAYLKDQNITHLVCLLEKYPVTTASLPNLCIPMSDHGESDLRQLLAQVVPFIEGAKEVGGRVLIFCALGVNRSPALAAGYLRAELGCPTGEALSRITSSRPFVSIHEKYLSQLEQLDDVLPVIAREGS